MISDDTLISILGTQVASAIGGYSSDLEEEQAKAIDYYYGRPYGDEIDGQSKIVTRDVLETIEWIMPSLLRVFSSGEKTVEFEPTGEEDEEQAEQETDYVNYVFNKENDGFILLHNWFKSALLMKNAYLKVWVEEEETVETENYTCLTDMGMVQVAEQEGAEIIEHDTEIKETDEGPVEYHSLKVRITTKRKRVKCAVVPQEELGIARNTNTLSLRDASFVFHRSPKTASDLILAGYDKDVVEGLPGWSGEKDGELEIARENLEDEDTTLYDAPDDSTREIEVFECYIRMDMEETGIATLWKITKAGDVILDKEEVDFIPFATLCPIPMPHVHIGLSEADLVMDIQRIGSVITRQALNNLYLTNNPEKEVLEKQVNMDDLLTSVSGGIKRVKQMGSIRELTVPFTAAASIPMLDMLKEHKESRTGVSRSTMGLDANTLAKATGMAFMGATEQANQRVEMLARVFAETGVKDAFRMIHELLIKHPDRKKVIKLRGKYVEIDTAEWKHRANMSVVVGLGTGNRDAELSQLFSLAEKQEQHLMNGSPIVTAKNVYNTYARLTERAGLKNADKYWTDPESPEAQQLAQQKAQNQQPDANMIMIQANKAIEDQKAELQRMKQEQDLYFKQRDLEMKEYEANLKAATTLVQEQIKAGTPAMDALANTVQAQDILEGAAE